MGQGYIFTGICDSVHSRGGSASVHAGIPLLPRRLPCQGDTPLVRRPPGKETPWQGDPLARRPPGKETSPGKETPLAKRPPGKETPLARNPPCALHAGRYGLQAGGMHPTGMQSCYWNKDTFNAFLNYYWQQNQSNWFPHVIGPKNIQCKYLNQSPAENLPRKKKVIWQFQLNKTCRYDSCGLQNCVNCCFYCITWHCIKKLHKWKICSFHKSQILCFNNNNIGIVSDLTLEPTIVFSVQCFPPQQSNQEKRLQSNLYCE